jgi:predicted nucleic acid-binding protein
MRRAVLDTNVLVAAIRSRLGASFRLLSLLQRTIPPFEPVVSVPLVVEYEEALFRHIRRSPLTRGDVEDLIDFLISVSIRQDVFFLWRPFLRDAADDFVLEAAVAARATHIVTHNVRHFEGAESFDLRIVTPARFLDEMGELS